VQRTTLLPRDQWAVLIPDHHPGFIDWATYEANTARLRSNWRVPRGFGGGPPREGTALLQGRLRCGKCSRLMQTGYSGTNGNCPRYVCARDRSSTHRRRTGPRRRTARVRAVRRTHPLRDRAGQAPVRRGRAGEPAGRPHPGTCPGNQARRAAASRTGPDRRPSPTPRPTHR
jgi:hypothetical protein